MRPYAERLAHPFDKHLFEVVRLAMKELPDIRCKPSTDEISCHHVARALAEIFPIEFEDGHFNKGWEHSWLSTPNGWIIDPYPVALIGGPILVDAGSRSPWRSLYVPAKLAVTETPQFRLDVALVTTLMRACAKKSGLVVPPSSEFPHRN